MLVLEKKYGVNVIMEFIEMLFALQDIESDYLMIFSNKLHRQLNEYSPQKDVSTKEEITKFLDKLTSKSYEQNGLSFSHSEFVLFKELVFHMGCENILYNIVDEMKHSFELEIPKEVDSENRFQNFIIRPIDTEKYSMIPKKYYLIIGGMTNSQGNVIKEGCAEKCKSVLVKLVPAKEINRVDGGFVIRTPLQNIPNISSELIKNNIAIYGLIPIE
jgi:hypothetical protein